MGCEKLVTYEPPAEKRTADIEKQSFDEAKALAAKNDLVGAHAKLTQIKADSPLRSTPEVTDIEDRWAKERLDGAKTETDKSKKLAMLDEVARAPYVSAELRARANDEMEKANPAPALPPPPGPPYNVKESDEALAQVRALGMQRRFKDAQDLLLKRYKQGPVAPREVDALKTLCVQNKDQGCLAVLIDGGALTQETANPQPRPGTGPGPGPIKR
jgi:hypothetical protein